jgi:hypothetical protein
MRELPRRRSIIIDDISVSAIADTVILNIDQEALDVTTEYEPDPDWAFVDTEGHFHAYSFDASGRSSLPTLTGSTITEPCNGCDDADCEGFQRTEYHCLLCGDLAAPRHRRTEGRKTIPGRENWNLNFKTRELAASWSYRGARCSIVLNGFTREQLFGIATLDTMTQHIGGWLTVGFTAAGPLGRRASNPSRSSATEASR